MKLKVVESFDSKDLNKVFFIEGSLKFGTVIPLKDGRKFEIIDIECLVKETKDGPQHNVIGLLRRII